MVGREDDGVGFEGFAGREVDARDDRVAQAQADALDVLQSMGFGRTSQWKAREDYDLVRALKRIADSPPQTVLNIERPIDEPASTTLGKLADFARVVSR